MGTAVRLGRADGTIDANGEVAGTVAGWWTDSDGRLIVGGIEWPLVPEAEGHS
jgi:hypothetical protein